MIFNQIYVYHSSLLRRRYAPTHAPCNTWPCMTLYAHFSWSKRRFQDYKVDVIHSMVRLRFTLDKPALAGASIPKNFFT